MSKRNFCPRNRTKTGNQKQFFFVPSIFTILGLPRPGCYIDIGAGGFRLFVDRCSTFFVCPCLRLPNTTFFPWFWIFVTQHSLGDCMELFNHQSLKTLGCVCSSLRGRRYFTLKSQFCFTKDCVLLSFFYLSPPPLFIFSFINPLWLSPPFPPLPPPLSWVFF